MSKGHEETPSATVSVILRPSIPKNIDGSLDQARTIHEYLLRRPIPSPAQLFSFGLLDGQPVRLRWPYLREASAGLGIERLATAFMNNPGQVHRSQGILTVGTP